jgi:hypothetical protein
VELGMQNEQKPFHLALAEAFDTAIDTISLTTLSKLVLNTFLPPEHRATVRDAWKRSADRIAWHLSAPELHQRVGDVLYTPARE